MRHYEIMLLIHPDQSERARVMMDRYVGIIEGGEGQVHRNEDLGRRMLAYPIVKVHKAHYMLMNVECGQETLEELVGALHFSDAVLRHLVIRRDEAVSGQSALARAAEKEAARENREYPHDREMAHGRKAPAGAPDAEVRDGDAPDQAKTDKAAADGAAAAQGDAPPDEIAAAQEASPAEQEAAAEEIASESPEAQAEEAADAPAAEQDAADDAADAAGAEAETEGGAEAPPAAGDAGEKEK